MILLTLVLVGCGSPAFSTGDPCVVEVQDASKAPLSEDALWGLVDQLEWTSVSWQLSSTSPTSIISLSLERALGNTTVVTRHGGDIQACRPGPELAVPVHMNISMDDGESTWGTDEDIFAADLTPEHVYFEGVQSTCTLTGAWLDAATQIMTTDFGAGDISCSALVFDGLAITGVEVDALYVDQDVGEALWNGEGESQASGS